MKSVIYLFVELMFTVNEFSKLNRLRVDVRVWESVLVHGQVEYNTKCPLQTPSPPPPISSHIRAEIDLVCFIVFKLLYSHPIFLAKCDCLNRDRIVKSINIQGVVQVRERDSNVILRRESGRKMEDNRMIGGA